VGAALIHADRRDMTNVIGTFRDYAKAPKSKFTHQQIRIYDIHIKETRKE
jgi:nitrogen fixation/metabolism regulation signal transduction histidine kinase